VNIVPLNVDWLDVRFLTKPFDLGRLLALVIELFSDLRA
jgi:hypothetical protein